MIVLREYVKNIVNEDIMIKSITVNNLINKSLLFNKSNHFIYCCFITNLNQ